MEKSYDMAPQKHQSKLKKQKLLWSTGETQDQNKWAANNWSEWAQYRLESPGVETEEKENKLQADFCTMSIQALNFWPGKFVLEVRRKDGRPYSPDTLYQICCALLCLLREADRADVNILADPAFCHFRVTIDARMKELRSSGKFQVKQSQVISEEQEDSLWRQGLLKDKHSQQLLDMHISVLYRVVFCTEKWYGAQKVEA